MGYFRPENGDVYDGNASRNFGTDGIYKITAALFAGNQRRRRRCNSGFDGVGLCRLKWNVHTRAFLYSPALTAGESISENHFSSFTNHVYRAGMDHRLRFLVPKAVDILLGL